MRLSPTIPLVALSLVFGNAFADPNGSMDPTGLQPIIAKADSLLSSGQYNDAAKTYTQAIEQSPINYLLYFKRATAHLSLNRHEPALADFDKVLELTSGSFDKALFSKGKIFAKEGRWQEAKDMIKKYTKKNASDRAAGDLLFSVSEAEVAAKKAVQASRASKWDVCVDESTNALKTASHSTAMRHQRVECALASGDIEAAVGDLTRLTHITAPSTDLFLRIAHLSYYLSPPSSQPLTTLKQCLHYDPDSKPCASAHRRLKKFDKQFKQLDELSGASDWRGLSTLAEGLATTFDDALKALTEGDGLGLTANIVPSKKSPRRKDIYGAVCRSYVNLNLPRKAEKWCDEVLAMDGGEDDIDALKGKGEAALLKEEWEEAVRIFNRAFEASGKSSQDLMNRLQKAQKLLKQSKRKDYYKVLGVARDADARTIKKAFRRAAKGAHPDKGGSEEKMATVNEAYEVLSKPELRARFDNGDDPNDPSSGAQGSYGNPFAQGGAPFFFQQGGGQGFPGGFHFSFGH